MENKNNISSSKGKISLLIDNKVVEAEEGNTILQAAKKSGIHIPTLCFHEKIKPHGACRLCLVEIEKLSLIHI